EGIVPPPAPSLHTDAARCRSRSRSDRAPAKAGRGRNSEPDQSAVRLRVSSALPARERTLPAGTAPIAYSGTRDRRLSRRRGKPDLNTAAFRKIPPPPGFFHVLSPGDGCKRLR